MPSEADRESSLDRALLAISAIVPTACAIFGARGVAPASHDEALVRTVGFGSTGFFRSLDVLPTSLAMILPIGSLAFRACLAGALAAGACGALAFVLGRHLLHALTEVVSRRAPSRRASSRSVALPLASVVAALCALSAALGPAVQTEASAPGGTIFGALLVLGTLATCVYDAPVALLALLLGASASHSPAIFVASLAAALPRLVTLGRSLFRKEIDRTESRVLALHAAASFALGLAPLALGFATRMRDPDLALTGSAFEAVATPRASLSTIAAFFRGEIGPLIAIAAGFAIVLGWQIVRRARFRSVLLSLVGVAVVGMVAPLFGALLTAFSISGTSLSAVFAIHLLASISLLWIVTFVAERPMPFAHLSAAFVVVLELVLPLRAVDDTLTRRASVNASTESLWNEMAWGSVSPASVLLVSRPRLLTRMTAARISGDLPGDLLVAPTFDIGGVRAKYALANEPKLTAIYRDFVLGTPPEESSFATLAAARPLFVSYDPSWDRQLARHFVPSGFATSYETEPRGASDRLRALDAFAIRRNRIAALVKPDVTPELSNLTVEWLRSRALAMAACGEKEPLSRAVDDLTTFAPDDALANALVRRMVTTKGPLDIRDLKP